MYCIIKRRHLLAVAAAVTALAVGAAGLHAAGLRQARATAAGVSNWGLSFPTAGAPPVGNATAEQLAEYHAYYLGDTSQNIIYLTFDAGYENGCTPAILDALKKHGVSATFFVVGHYLETAPELVNRMVAEGHTVGNHTYHHPDMSAIADRQAFTEELQSVEALYQQVTGQTMKKLYRPPQGKYSENNLRMANDMGYATVFWSLAYVDWYVDNQPTPQQAFDKLVTRIHPGAIVLLHSTSATNAAILDDLLTKWENLGYSFGRLPELCGV